MITIVSNLECPDNPVASLRSSKRVSKPSAGDVREPRRGYRDTAGELQEETDGGCAPLKGRRERRESELNAASNKLRCKAIRPGGGRSQEEKEIVCSERCVRREGGG